MAPTTMAANKPSSKLPNRQPKKAHDGWVDGNSLASDASGADGAPPRSRPATRKAEHDGVSRDGANHGVAHGGVARDGVASRDGVARDGMARDGVAVAARKSLKISTVSHTLDAEVAERLRHFAFRERISESAVIEFALRELFSSAPQDSELGDRLREAGAALRRKS